MISRPPRSPVEAESDPRSFRVTEVETWNHFTALLAALDAAAHGRDESGQTFQTVLSAFARLVESEAAARLAGNGTPALYDSPLADPGTRRLLAGLIDLACYQAGSEDDYRELRWLLQSFESAPSDPPADPERPEP